MTKRPFDRKYDTPAVRLERLCDPSSIQAGKGKRRKRKILVAICITLALSAILCLINVFFCDFDLAYAGDANSKEEIEKQLGQSVDDAIDGLDLDELESYLKSLADEQSYAVGTYDVKALLKSLVSGSSRNFFTEFANALGATLGKYFLGFLPSAVAIIIICLLKNMLGGLTGDFLRNQTTEVVHIVCYSAIVVVLMTGIIGVTRTVTDTVDGLTRFAGAILPALLTLTSMLGGATTAATFSPYMAALSAMIIKLVSAVIVPAFIATVIFGVVGNLSSNVKLDKLTKLVKSSSSWLIGIVFGLFGTFLTVQGVAGGVVDKFGFNVAKFALSSYVPILGGYLSDGMDLLSASLVLTKNALGYTGVIILVCTVAFPLVRVVIFSLTLRLVAAIAEPIGDGRVASLLSGVAKNINLLVTALAGAAFMFFLLLMALIGSCNML